MGTMMMPVKCHATYLSKRLISLSRQKLEVILSLQLLLRESSPIVPLNLMTLVRHPWHVWHPNSCYETIVSDKQKKEVSHIHLPRRVLVISHTGHNSCLHNSIHTMKLRQEKLTQYSMPLPKYLKILLIL